MKKLKYILLSLFCSIVVSKSVYSQMIETNFLFTAKNNIVNSNFQFDPTFIATLGYGKIFTVKEKKVLVSTGFSVPIFLLKTFDNTVLNADMSTFLLTNRWNVKAKIGVKYDFYDNSLTKGQNIAAYIGLTPGYFTEKWFAGAEIFYKQNFITSLRHHDIYSQNFEGATEGWFKNRAGFFYFSAKGGYIFKEKMELTMRISYKIPKTLKQYPPFTIAVAAGLGINYYF